MTNEELALAMTQVQILLNSDKDISKKFIDKYKNNLIKLEEIDRIAYEKECEQHSKKEYSVEEIKQFLKDHKRKSA